MYLQALKFIGW